MFCSLLFGFTGAWRYLNCKNTNIFKKRKPKVENISKWKKWASWPARRSIQVNKFWWVLILKSKSCLSVYTVRRNNCAFGWWCIAARGIAAFMFVLLNFSERFGFNTYCSLFTSRACDARTYARNTLELHPHQFPTIVMERQPTGFFHAHRLHSSRGHRSGLVAGSSYINTITQGDICGHKEALKVKFMFPENSYTRERLETITNRIHKIPKKKTKNNRRWEG